MAKKEKQARQQPEVKTTSEVKPAPLPAPAPEALVAVPPAALPAEIHENENALSRVEGLGGLDGSDLTIPRMRILQPTSDEAASGEGKPGTITCNLTGESFDALHIVPLFFRKSRAVFESGTKKPVCASDDALMPATRITQPFSPRCAVIDKGRMVEVCPHAKWGGEDGADPPECQLSYNLFCLDEHDETPFIITLKGKSVRPTKKLISYCALRKVSPFNVSVLLGTEKETNTKGTYYVATFSEYKPVEPKDKHREAFLALKSYDINRTYDAEEQVAPEVEEPSAPPDPLEPQGDDPF